MLINTDKTEAIVVDAKNNFDSHVIDSIIIIDNADVTRELLNHLVVIKSLGDLIDEHHNFEKKVNATIQVCYTDLRNLRTIGSQRNFSIKGGGSHLKISK